MTIATKTVKERPINLSAEMVNAILAGRKTQTRRLIKLPRWTVADDVLYMDEVSPSWPHAISAYSGCMARVECPYGKPGDRLWVRETWGYTARVSTDGQERWLREQDTAFLIYRATSGSEEADPWRSSIHMPRWASRILLEITDVRVQRVQEINNEDAVAEGALEARHLPYVGGMSIGQARIAFAALWDSVHGEWAWERNDWVWAISFQPAQP